MSAHPDLAGGRLIIDLAALVWNWKYLAKIAGSAECAAVVKANAYGCGIEPVVEALYGTGCRTFFVALPEEGQRVRTIAPAARCFVLNGLFKDAAHYFLENGLLPVLSTMNDVETWSVAAREHSLNLGCAVQMDSGMNRLGLTAQECSQLAADIQQNRYLNPQVFMTHYACADDIGHPKTEVQRERFMQAARQFPEAQYSCANSAAVLQDAGHAFDLARPGIALYGGEALNDTPNPMKPVVTLQARINQLRQANPGETVGYGASETLTRTTRIAHVSVGYADGFHRSASHMGVGHRLVSPPCQAAFEGRKINGIGRISMDLMAFDVTDVPEAEIQQGDWIELFGPTIALDDVARASGTIGYELLTGLSTRYSRTYLPADT